MKTPSEELAEIILEKLAAEHCIIQDDAEKLISKMATGKVRTEDWKLAIEKGVHGKKKS